MATGEPREVATLGGGCFWCLEPVFEALRGVEKVVCGYAGGHLRNPTYEQVCTGTTGHAEVVEVTFEPRTVSFENLLHVFFAVHDPTTLNRQGPDVGTQYRSAIFYHTPEQRATADRVIRELQETAGRNSPIVTDVAPSSEFYPAEAYHQHYFRRNPSAGYCRAVVAPKVAKFRKAFQEALKD